MIEARPLPSTAMDLEHTLEEASRRVDAFRSLVAHIPYEAKGVLTSEMLFLVAAVGNHRPPKIVESGRARGQSTCILGLAFAGVPVVSIERDAHSPDAIVATERCAGLENVELHFGDANVELPARVSAGDIVVIDGPKGWHALKLALTVLAKRRPAAVFVHDCYKGQAERRFLERHVPGAFFSDDARFEAGFAELDGPVFETARREGFESWQPHAFDGRTQASYGPTYACLPWRQGIRYGSVLRRMVVARTISRIRRSFMKRMGE